MSQYVKPPGREWLKKRLMGGTLCVAVAFSILLARFVYLQVIKGEWYHHLSANNCIRLQSIPAPRGLIYDRNGALLVDNRPSFDLKIVLKDAVPVDQTLSRLARLMAVPVEELREKIDSKSRRTKFKPILLKRNISRNQLAVVKAHGFDLPGVIIDVEPRRNYIHEKCAAHVLGYLGEINAQELKKGNFPDVRSGDSIGRDGVEKEFESLLHGKRGGRQVEVDATGRLVRVLNTVDPVPGQNIFLTIDLELQQAAEALIQGRSGAVVALDPATGDVLCMASSPAYNQNDFIGGISHKKWRALQENPGRPMTNKAIQGEYPPASTYKIVSAIAGLEEGVVSTHTSRFCSGRHRYGNRIYRCWKKWGHGDVDIFGSLEKSCDVFYYRVGEDVGVDTLAQYARGCGLGKPTGIELRKERPGLIPTAAWKRRRFGVSWQGGETLSIAIGQGFNLVTPLQMAVLIAAVGNEGTLYRPRILHAVQLRQGETPVPQPPEITGGLPAGKETLRIVREGLRRVIHGKRGTARAVKIDGITMAGKTGTAQVFSMKKKDRERSKDEPLDYLLRDHAWFVCYAPAENPVIAVSVLIEHGEHGSTAAAPVASQVVKTWLDRIGYFDKQE
ncbi:peptidoglycan glycosyltransferase [Desulfocicer vacuolatum DSM 3385]|uniref:Peptidoglycan glycosyltransferase n=1 Tax=Desulfocicer vacuolatum DSM 3385 TaxID=1121400 RepID=A0A1W1YZK5_9BACT|nr:penicillin-binding protein 2 [Desulfocicer vacuolatum]SMC41629.1 peptidoglycan glycosyltransferase [Desulfocicer vacuolatum DSM 3385]